MYNTMTWFFTSLCSFLSWFGFKIFLFLEKYIDRRIVDENDQMECKNQKRLDFDEKGEEKESSFLVQSKCEYISRQDSLGFMEKPEAKSFSIKEMFVNFNEGEEKELIDKNSDHKLFCFSFFNDVSGLQEHIDDTKSRGGKAKSEFFDEKNVNDQEKLEFLGEKNVNDQENLKFFGEMNVNDQENLEFFGEKNVNDQEKLEYFGERNANDQEKGEENVGDLCCEEILKQDDEVFSDEETQNSEDICYEIHLVPENLSFGRNSSQGSYAIGDEDLITSDELYFTRHHNRFLNVDQFMEVDGEKNDDMGFIELETSLHNLSSSIDTEEFASKSVDGVEVTDVKCEEVKLMDDFQESVCHNSSRKSWDTDDFGFENVDQVGETDVNCEEVKLMEDFQESVDHNSSRKSWDTDDFAFENVNSIEVTNVNYEEKKLMDDFQESPEHYSGRKSWDTDSDSDDDECDILLEHQNLVRQMKMEMKNSRITGLPTISEDCESPKVVEDLKPLKIDEKIVYKDCIEEIQKFYKSYAEKMRKLDILNYQTLNAISFLQLKDSEVFMSSKKASISITKAFALPSFLANKQRKIFADPSQKSISEMNRDLEIVYVGQICLSWEILCWQYGKSKELLEHDPHEYRTYNQVAGEYQQFQVLLQRFVEDEPFQGPRVQNYVRKRCILRSFLQVPSIRDDRFKGKQHGHVGEKDVISIVKLAEIIKETMQVFWEFLRADKCEANFALKGVHGPQTDTAEIELFMNVKLDLRKKERKLKDVQRSGNCIVKKFQKQQEHRLSHHSLFASLVELKLVSRVISLPRLRRDYLVWCQRKLSNINVAGRKVSMEQSFSLFPC
ncbi:putative transcription factor HB29-like [Capsicum annuum]|uniref:uncharacterized protein LOC107870912 isoform X1 n=2 Tax=Capsicum annuum TaxID=4072 RepID=UPI0007BF2DB1|nr:uncharacterized protein LOC107870912 isoform X1 [Capsicum annuum]KAF3658463.1 putative transcription factor HB29-like [Capsicum annuum]